MSKRSTPPLVNEEVLFGEDQQLVSTTDLKGKLTYANPIFCQVAGYSEEELLGKPHNQVRHPDMPKAAFRELWAHIREGKSWRGAVKNLCKDGRYYWVDAYVTPIFQNGQVTGYQSVRTRLAPIHRQRAEKLYSALKQKEAAKRKVDTVALCAKKGLRTPLAIFILLFAFVLIATASNGLLTGLWCVGLLGLAALLAGPSMLANQKYFRQLQTEYDSASRLVFSGNPSYSIADFHLQLQQSKIRTILGPVDV